MEDSVNVLFDQVESQAALVAEGILKLVEPLGLEEDSSTSEIHESRLLEEIVVALDGLTKLTSKNDVRSGKEIAERLSDMEDFLRLMLRLMQEMMTSEENIVLTQLYIDRRAPPQGRTICVLRGISIFAGSLEGSKPFFNDDWRCEKVDCNDGVHPCS